MEEGEGREGEEGGSGRGEKRGYGLQREEGREGIREVEDGWVFLLCFYIF